MKEEIHIGHLIHNKINEQGRMVQWIAEKLHCSKSNIYKMYDKTAIETELLLRISLILQYDFFAHYSQYINKKCDYLNR